MSHQRTRIMRVVFNGNMAFKVKGAILNDMLEAEEAIVRYTNGKTLPRVDVREQSGGELCSTIPNGEEDS